MNKINYSVIIRTTGKAGEKYRKLLSSIDSLVPKPKEVIVVLPEGYDLPADQLGWETFYFCPKGMVIQRLKGIEFCKTQYALICDDDVVFDSYFVEKLYKPIQYGIASFSAGPLYSFLPKKGLNSLLDMIMGIASPMIFHKKDCYISVLKSTGYSYNRHLNIVESKFYNTQSLPWTCFFADVNAFKSLKLEDETWLDSHGYSALDDQTMFYKAFLMGYKTVVVSDAFYEHLDAKTSTRNNKPTVLYSSSFNRVVFWHRFIYSVQQNIFSKLFAKVSFFYTMHWILLWQLFSVLRKKMTYDEYKILLNGYFDGCKYIKSMEYQQLSKKNNFYEGENL